MAGVTYQNFDLRIERGATGAAETPPRYRATVFASPAGEANTEFTLAVPQDAAPEVAGRLMFEAAFSGEVLTALRRSLDKVAQHDAGLRIRLRLADVPELTNLPWEALYDPSRDRFLALSSETPLVRYLDLPEAIEPLKTQPPLRILPVMASPQDLPPLDLAAELAALRDALADLTGRGLIEIEPQAPRTLAALRDALRRRPYHIIHFLGHGDLDVATGEGFQILEDRMGGPRPVTGQALGAILGDHRSLRLVLLNACRGAAATAHSPYAGVAGRLVQQAIPAVLAMRTAISDPAAVAFAHEFYTAIADGYAVDAATSEARKALFTEGLAGEWATPVLFMRAADGRVFDLPARLADEEIEDRVNGDKPTPPEPVRPPQNGQRARPALGGDSIGHYRGGAATLGCLAQDRQERGRVYILCDRSGLCPAAFSPRAGDPIVQPGIVDGGNPATDIIAEIARWAVVRDDPPNAAANISAALAAVRGLTDVSPELRGRGFLRGVRQARSGQPVFAVGRTGGVLSGVRNTPGPDGAVPIPFGEVIECSAMLGPGDSGAILVDAENYALGLGFAGNDQISLFHPMQRVLDALNVDLITEEVWRELAAPKRPEEAGPAAFISYAPADREWVFDTLLPQIEQAGLRAIVDVRDFAPGRSRLDNIVSAVETCRHTIAVLTPDYVADEWQALETLSARTADPAAWRRKLIPVKLKPCAVPRSITAIALEVADLTDPYAARYALPRLLKALS
jgi:hypothetical protein